MEVTRVLKAFKLNPYEKLNLRFDCTLDDVKKRFRKLSLLIHPDKSNHPRANQAFKCIQDALSEILDEQSRNELHHILGLALEDVQKDRKKETAKDVTLKAADLLEIR